MATTKIWPIKDSLKRVVDYAVNPEKTAGPGDDLFNVLHYAANEDKTEKRFYVTGINCVDKLAYSQMMATKQKYGKLGGNVAYHCYQSFKPGEVTAEQCHAIGVELADRLWGGLFEVVVATHLNTNCYHNHFVINSVSCVDGHKFDDSKRTYAAMRLASDEICREHGLSVIENPAHSKTPRAIFIAERKGEPTKHNLARQAIDEAVTQARTPNEFRAILRSQGYMVTRRLGCKYQTIYAEGWKRPIRLKSLGEGYDEFAIAERIRRKPYRQTRMEPPVLPLKPTVKRCQFQGNLKTARKITGFRALYLRWCYALGILPKNSKRKPLSPAMREEIRKMNRYVKQTQLLCRNKIGTAEELASFLEKNRLDMDALVNERKHIDNKIRRTKLPDEKSGLKAQRHELSVRIGVLRGNIGLASDVAERSESMKKMMAEEARLRQEQPRFQYRSMEREER